MLYMYEANKGGVVVVVRGKMSLDKKAYKFKPKAEKLF